jgi:hypothetical protein
VCASFKSPPPFPGVRAEIFIFDYDCRRRIDRCFPASAPKYSLKRMTREQSYEKLFPGVHAEIFRKRGAKIRTTRAVSRRAGFSFRALVERIHFLGIPGAFWRFDGTDGKAYFAITENYGYLVAGLYLFGGLYGLAVDNDTTGAASVRRHRTTLYHS